MPRYVHPLQGYISLEACADSVCFIAAKGKAPARCFVAAIGKGGMHMASRLAAAGLAALLVLSPAAQAYAQIVPAQQQQDSHR